jgi:hypothetical protein
MDRPKDFPRETVQRTYNKNDLLLRLKFIFLRLDPRLEVFIDFPEFTCIKDRYLP